MRIRKLYLILYALIFILFYVWLDEIRSIFINISLYKPSFSRSYHAIIQPPSFHVEPLVTGENAVSHHKSISSAEKFHPCASKQCVVLCVVSCGNRFNETITMIKSAIALSHSLLVIEIFTEENFVSLFNSWSSSWPDKWKSRAKLNVNLAKYPPWVNDKTWRSLFRECASVRLFLPSLLPKVDSLIYVDTDILFLSSVEKLWSFFSLMNSSQMAAMSPEHEDLATGWYNRFARHPYYGNLGVNSGVMLMNLTRLRLFSWEDYLPSIEKEFRSKLTWGDQDIINIIFHYHPDKLYIIPCEYNYRPDHCMYVNTCKTVVRYGVRAIHGSRRVFHNEKQPAFKAVYDTWHQFQPQTGDLRQDVYYPLSKFFLLDGKNSNCGKMGESFLKNLRSKIRL